MAAVKPFSFNGNLKGEILLANGSRVLFDAPRWEFSYPTMHNSGYCTIKAEECPDQAGIHIDGKQFAQKIREMQNQSIKINVELTEEGKRMLKDTILGKVEDKHSKPPVGSHELLEEMYKVLLEYVETFPREIELRDRAYPLINRVYENLKEWADNALASEKETPKKKEESTDLFDVISKTTHNFPNACSVTAQSDKDSIMATYYTDTHLWELKVWRLQGKSIPVGETKLKTDLQAMANKHNIDLTKGWKVVNHQYKY